MQVDGTVLVRNRMRGLTVLASSPTGKDEVRWEALDDPNGGDVQMVPESLAKSPNFARAVTRHVLEIIDPDRREEMMDKIAQQGATWIEGQQAASTQVDDTIDRTSQVSLVQVKCVTAACPAELSVRETSLPTTPPLCERHEHTAHLFVPSEGPLENNKPTTKWIMAGMTPRNQLPADET